MISESPCTTCTGYGNRCTNCIANYTLVNPLSLCYPNCPSTEYYQASTKLCLPCPEGCHYCYDGYQAKCFLCSQGYHWDFASRTCLPYAPAFDFSFRIVDGSLKACSIADLASVRCLRLAGLPYTPSLLQYLLPTEQYAACPPTMFECSRRWPAMPSNPVYPLSCASGYTLFNTSCISSKHSTGFVDSNSMTL